MSNILIHFYISKNAFLTPGTLSLPAVTLTLSPDTSTFSTDTFSK